MEILMINYWHFQPHGIAGIHKTANFFATNGHKVKVFVPTERIPENEQEIELHSNIKVFKFNLPFRFLSGIPKLNRIRQLTLFVLYSFVFYQKVFKRSNKPDLIYTVACDAMIIGYLLSRICKIPHVMRFYGISTILLKNPYKHFFYYLSLKLPADLAIVTDDGTNGKKILRNINPNIKRIEFWKDGIDPVVIDKKEIAHLKKSFQIKEKETILLTVSRLYGWKRVHRAIRLLSFLKEETRKNIRLLIVGDGPEKKNLEKLAMELGFFDKITFAGKVLHDYIYNYYGLADIFLSLYDMSNVGNPLLEALATGCCIVTINTGETSRVIKNKVNGILIEFKKNEEDLSRELSSSVQELIENEKLRNKIRRGAKEYAKRNIYTWNARLKLELVSLTNLLENHGK
jgi:glycosyltransferase involved in cell wall biosynthesis